MLLCRHGGLAGGFCCPGVEAFVGVGSGPPPLGTLLVEPFSGIAGLVPTVGVVPDVLVGVAGPEGGTIEVGAAVGELAGVGGVPVGVAVAVFVGVTTGVPVGVGAGVFVGVGAGFMGVGIGVGRVCAGVDVGLAEVPLFFRLDGVIVGVLSCAV